MRLLDHGGRNFKIVTRWLKMAIQVQGHHWSHAVWFLGGGRALAAVQAAFCAARTRPVLKGRHFEWPPFALCYMQEAEIFFGTYPFIGL